MESHPVLQVDNLTVDYTGATPRRLVDGLSFSIPQGRTVAIVGESGAGKSMTSLAVMGLLPEGVSRSGGRIVIDGQDTDGLSGEAMRALRGGLVAMILQNPMSAFDPVCSIRSHFKETLLAHETGLSKAAITQRARAALAEAGFSTPDAVLDIYPFQMSGGMLQRVMIAIALTGNPLLLIADEATTDLDVMSQKQIVDLLRERRRERGLSLMLITHDLSVAAALADEVLVMHQGRAVEMGSVQQIFFRPEHAYTQHLVAAHYALYEGRFATFFQDTAKGGAHASA